MSEYTDILERSRQRFTPAPAGFERLRRRGDRRRRRQRITTIVVATGIMILAIGGLLKAFGAGQAHRPLGSPSAPATPILLPSNASIVATGTAFSEPWTFYVGPDRGVVSVSAWRKGITAARPASLNRRPVRGAARRTTG